jgi:hypothetical protein
MARKVGRDALSGQFVKPAKAAKSPRTTSTERVGRGTSNAKTVTRSTITGKFVKESTAKRHPDTTISQRV